MEGTGFNGNIYEEYAQLLNRARSGDETAFAEIYQKSERLVYTTCYRILNNKESAEDAMQETYLALYNSLDTIRDGKALVAWLSRTAYFKSCDLGDKNRNNVSYDDAIASEEIPEEADDSLDSLPESLIAVKANRDIISNILKKELSQEQYIATFLFYYNELPVSEIAAMMNCPENTVKSRLKASRTKIRVGIESYERLSGDSLAGAAGIPFLTKFFIASANDIPLPAPGVFPIPGIGQSAQLGNLAQPAPAQLGNLAGQAPQQLGNLAQPAQLGSLAQPAGTAGSAATKLGVLASPIFKVGVIVTAVVVTAVPSAILTRKIVKEKLTKESSESSIHEYIDESSDPFKTTSPDGGNAPEFTLPDESAPTDSSESAPESETSSDQSVPAKVTIKVTDAVNKTFKREKFKYPFKIPKVTISGVDTSAANKTIKNEISKFNTGKYKNVYTSTYKYYINDKTVSILVANMNLLGGDNTDVKVYNIEISTGNLVSNGNLLKLYGTTDSAFFSKAKSLFSKFNKATIKKYKVKGYEKKWINENTKHTSYKYVQPYINSKGHLCFIGITNCTGGSGVCYTSFDLSTKKYVQISYYKMISKAK